MILTNKEKGLIDVTSKVCLLSSCRYKHGAIITRGSIIIAMGFNKFKTHTMHKEYGSHVVSIHAEMAAIIRARIDLTDCILYSVRIKNDGEYGISKPCKSCYKLILESGIRQVMYYDGTQFIKTLIHENV